MLAAALALIFLRHTRLLRPPSPEPLCLKASPWFWSSLVAFALALSAFVPASSAAPWDLLGAVAGIAFYIALLFTLLGLFLLLTSVAAVLIDRRRLAGRASAASQSPRASTP